MGCTLDGAALDNKADERGSGRGWYEEEGCPRETEREGKRIVERRRVSVQRGWRRKMLDH